jgi:hypothetical protein
MGYGTGGWDFFIFSRVPGFLKTKIFREIGYGQIIREAPQEFSKIF